MLFGLLSNILRWCLNCNMWEMKEMTIYISKCRYCFVCFISISALFIYIFSSFYYIESLVCIYIAYSYLYWRFNSPCAVCVVLYILLFLRLIVLMFFCASFVISHLCCRRSFLFRFNFIEIYFILKEERLWCVYFYSVLYNITV